MKNEVMKPEGKNLQVIEIKGVKFEVDLREAKRIHEYRVGDPVKVLVKEYQDNWKSYTGIIADFIEFQNQPTIVIAYLKIDYSEAKIEFVNINTNTKEEIEIAPLSIYEVEIKKSDVMSMMDKQIEKKREEINEIEYKKNLFEANFGKFFKEFNKKEGK